jgi:hypothetical protein
MYRATLSLDRQVLFDQFQLVDAAFKVVGVGSVGTHCYVTLWMTDVDDPLFLQGTERICVGCQAGNSRLSGHSAR